MGIKFLDQQGQEEGLDVSGLYQGGANPDEDVVNALMHAVEFGTWAPSDKRRRSEGLADTIREACLSREPNEFLPPKRLSPRKTLGGYDLSTQARMFWRTAADLLLWKAQCGAFTSAQMSVFEQKDKTGSVRRPRMGYAVKDDKEHFYFDFDTTGQNGDVLVAQVGEIEAEVRRLLKNALNGVMRDKGTLDEVQHTSAMHTKVMAEVALKHQIEFIEYVRSQVEDTEDQVMFTNTLQQALTALGIDDLDVELLTGKDAILYGCQGLYTPALAGSKAKVSIPLSTYGTTDMRENNDILKIFAHEVSHHLLAKAKIRQLPDEGGPKDKYQIEVVPGSFFAIELPRGASVDAWVRESHGAMIHGMTTRLVTQALSTVYMGFEGGANASAWIQQIRTNNPQQLIVPDGLKARGKRGLLEKLFGWNN